MAEGSDGTGCSKAPFWRQTLEAWQRSGLKQSQYQRQHGLTKNAFTYWKLKLLGRGRPAATLVALPGAAPGQRGVADGGTAIAVRVGGRYVVELADGFEPQTLARVLEVLEGRRA